MLKEGKVISIKKVSERKRKVYDLKVEDNHNFFLDNGILTHNSGKGEAVSMVRNLTKEINRINPVVLNIIMASLEGGSSVESLFSRPRIKKNGGLVRDKKGDPVMIPSIFEVSDIVYSTECSFLFKTRKDANDWLETFLPALEGEKIAKQLVKYEDFVVETNFKAGYLGTSRPVDSIKAVITQSGLLQRTTFIARNLTPEGRMKNLEPISRRYLDDSFLIEYRKKIKKLAREFYDLYNQTSQKLIIDDSDTFNPREMLREFMLKQQEYVNREIVNKTVAEVMAGFIARESKHIIKLAYINAFYKKSSVVRKEHFEEAFEFMQTLFDYQVYWLEENLVEEREVGKQGVN